LREGVRYSVGSWQSLAGIGDRCLGTPLLIKADVCTLSVMHKKYIFKVEDG
jgi:hypothetical protein